MEFQAASEDPVQTSHSGPEFNERPHFNFSTLIFRSLLVVGRENILGFFLFDVHVVAGKNSERTGKIGKGKQQKKRRRQNVSQIVEKVLALNSMYKSSKSELPLGILPLDIFGCSKVSVSQHNFN